MRILRLPVIALSIALLILNSSFAPAFDAQAASDDKQGAAGREQPPAGASGTPLNDIDSTQSRMRGVIERYVVDRGSLNRSYTAEPSPARRKAMKQFYTDWLDSLGKMGFDSLSHEEQVDYLLFANHLHHELRQLDMQARQFDEVAALVPFSQTIIDFEEARRGMKPVDPRQVAVSLTRLGKQIEQTRKAVEAGLKPEGKIDAKAEEKGAGEKADVKPAGKDEAASPIRAKKTVANRAAGLVNGLRNTLKVWFGFYNGYDPVFTWWNGEPYKTVDQALQNYSAFLREKVVGVKPDDNTAIVGDPIGREALLSELAYEMIPYTPEELIAIANKEMEWCEAEMKRASRELGYGDDWMKALEYVKTLHVEPGKQPDLIRELAIEAIEFVEKHDLVTVPQLARDTWRMEMMTPERQLVSPFFLGGETILVSYPTNTMTHEQKLMSMRGNNIHFSRATVHHELIPGHHLQGFMTQRYKPYRMLFNTPFWTEGWALYWEMLLWDMNFAKTPENRIGMLFWRMHRSARIVFSLSFHLEKMTPEQCIDLLVKQVGHEPDNAAAEVRRSFAGQYGPLYQCAYLLGGLQFRALNKELVGAGKMTARAFHDWILKENRIPVEMVRAVLTRQKLARNFGPSWKFYGPNP
jgi:uncharacterized protein (DUF885 family)